MFGRATAFLLSVVIAVACVRPAPNSPVAQFLDDPQQLVARVAALRALENRRPARLVFHDEQEFFAALRAQADPSERPRSNPDTAGFYRAFNLPTLRPGDETSVDELQREQLVAFYDQHAHTIRIRRQQLDQDSDAEALSVVAHEVGHSLQFQHFPIPDLDQIAELDRWLATMALVEGDAMLAMLAYVADTQHVPLKRVLVQVKRRVEAHDFREAIRASGTSPKLFQLSPIVRERVLFPYFAGTTFVGAIHRAGGFALVNRVYRSPPTTTEQVLHPDRYLAGEPPALIPIPSPLPACTSVGSGRMGELQTRVLLEQCLPRAQARNAAAGWGGDAFRLLRTAGGKLALLWSTAWDTEADATEFERALRATAHCGGAAPSASKRLGIDDSVVVRDRDRVVYAQGLPKDLGVGVGRRLLAQSLSRPRAVPPLGPVGIPPVKPVRRVRPPLIAGRTYTHERAGITLPILPGFVGRIQAGVFVMVRRSRLPATGTALVSELLVTPAGLEQLFGQFASGFAQASAGEDELEYEATAEYPTPLGRAVARSWSLSDSDGMLRVVVLPVCSKTGSLVFSQLWWDELGRTQLEEWLRQLQPIRAGPPPICAELDP